MKNTNVLNIETNLFLKNNIIIHPNTGYDLGILNNSTHVKIFANTSIDAFRIADKYFVEGDIILENKCRQDNIQLSKKYWNSIGKPEKIRLFYEDNKILISNI